MKLNRLMSGTFAAAAVALACGCSSTASAPPKVALAAQTVDPNVTGTTNLMSAEIPGPKPKVGKAHLGTDSLGDREDADLDAPKTARRSDGSRRGGGFGTYSK